MLDEATPLFLQIAEQLIGDIATGMLAEGTRVPSTNEFAAFHRINPATAAKGINVLVDAGLLEKRRGVGMFVVDGARASVLQRRRDDFAANFIAPMLAEARRLNISREQISSLIDHSLIES